MTIRAALLDAEGVFQRMDEVADESQLTSSHLPQIKACDLPPGKYKWIADEKSEHGGAFWPLAWLASLERDREAVIGAAQAASRLAERRAARKAERERE